MTSLALFADRVRRGLYPDPHSSVIPDPGQERTHRTGTPDLQPPVLQDARRHPHHPKGAQHA